VSRALRVSDTAQVELRSGRVSAPTDELNAAHVESHILGG